ncbi:MAG: chemotaxis-specific protein-glutamate methyltransferase CheB [bacterium]|jgi:two-component system chemotaxis response regulator CheB|nr:chemotaxis-specific protein-glutamate methyltransferase CheB [bacterium]
MSSKLKVIILEEDEPRRRKLQRFLAEQPPVEVIGVISLGEKLLKAAIRDVPDVVIISTYTGDGEGLTAVRQLMANFPKPILIAGSRSGLGASEALAALRCGAIDIVPHPADIDLEERDRIGTLFQEKVALAARIKVIRHLIPVAIPLREKRPRRRLNGITDKRVVAVGASTGGPILLQNLFQSLPGDTPVAFLVVQHILKHFTAELANSLAALSRLTVKEAEMNETIRPGCVYISPGNRHMTVGSGNRIQLADGPEVSGHRPSVDVLMESVAQKYGERAVGILLTGMGRDGVEGMRCIKERGGVTIAQDEATSVVFGMPGAAIAAGVVDYVLAAEDLPVKILGLV